MKVNIKKLHPDAVIPKKTYESDFCYDCVAISEEEISPNVWKYGLGIALQLNREDSNWFSSRTEHILSIDVRPRSSIYKTGMSLANSVGTCDELYTGEISVIFYHILRDLPRYKIGDRVCQIKLGVTTPLTFNEVSELSSTERGSGGFGSTGK